jgi:hypothetical protein
VVDRAGLLHLVGDEGVALVEEEKTKLLLLGKGHGRAAIVENGAPGRQHRTLRHRALGQAPRRRLDDLQVRDDAVADPIDLHEALRRRRQRLGEGAEAFEDFLGDGFDVAARDRAEEDQFEQFVIGQAVAARLRERARRRSRWPR